MYIHYVGITYLYMKLYYYNNIIQNSVYYFYKTYFNMQKYDMVMQRKNEQDTRGALRMSTLQVGGNTRAGHRSENDAWIERRKSGMPKAACTNVILAEEKRKESVHVQLC